ncbi:hypothetical protein [Microbacterium sp.]|uniref:hypothetical protein n=1 Tax=Microbacterium sp. TaxID=51671 RepID=UPI003F9A72D3
MTNPAPFLAGWDTPAPAQETPEAHLEPVQPLPDTPAPVEVPQAAQDAYELLPVVGKVALLAALKDGINAILEQEKKTVADVNQDASDAVKQPSVFGQVNYQPPKPKRLVDEDALIEYVKTRDDLAEHIQTVEIVPDWVRSAVIESATDQGDGIFTFDDGTVADFLSHGNPSRPQVAYPASKQQKATKAAAEEAVRGILGTIAAQVTAATRQAK